MFDGLLKFYQRGFIGATLLLYLFVYLKGLLVNKPRGHKQGGWGYPKRPRHGNIGGGGLVLVQICPRGLFTAPNKQLFFLSIQLGLI